jgi:hypothetical protein
MSALLARQTRVRDSQDAGATRRMLSRWYLVAMAGLAAVPLALAWVPAHLGTEAGSRAVLRLLNFDLKADVAPTWLSGVVVVAAFSLPLVVTLLGIVRATRVAVSSMALLFSSGASTEALRPT